MNIDKKEINIDYLFLDLTKCKRCVDTDLSLKNSINRISDMAKDIGATINIKKIHIDTEQKAAEYGLEVSPTIRINGRDIQNNWTENKCTECGDLCECAGNISCRTWNWNGKQYSSAPEALIIDAILNNIYSNQYSTSDHAFTTDKLNKNIKTFFSEKRKSADKARGSCC